MYKKVRINKVLSIRKGNVSKIVGEQAIKDFNSTVKKDVLAKHMYYIAPLVFSKLVEKCILNIRQHYILTYLINNNEFLTKSAIRRKCPTVSSKALTKDIEKLFELGLIQLGFTKLTNAGLALQIREISQFEKLLKMSEAEIEEMKKGNKIEYKKLIKVNKTYKNMF